MSKQRHLDGELSEIDEAIVYYRPVKSKKRLTEAKEQVIDSPSELADVEELIGYIQNKKLNYPMKLSESKMEELTSDRVIRIFESDGSQRYVEDLLSVFCETLEGRQKSDDKYAMLVYTDDKYLLAHARSEQGMSLHQKKDDNEVKLIKRFLDVDNILSAALFEHDQQGVEFSHFTDSGSDSFRSFLGVNEHRLNYRRKTIQILCYYQGRREYSCKFEFTNDEFSDKWLRDGDIVLSDNKLRFHSDEGKSHPHELKEIRWGSDTYESVESFKSDFKEESLGLNIERDKYEDLHSYPSEDGEDISIYNSEKTVDHRRKVEINNQDGGREFINKSKTPDNLHVLYADQQIALNSDFADDIFKDIINESQTRIYHASSSPAPKALQIGSVTFLNVSEEKIANERIRFLEEMYEHATNRAGETLRKCLVNALLHILRQPVERTQEHAIDQLINIYSGNPTDGATISTKENEGPDLVEYKNREHLETDDPAAQIVSEIQTEIQKGIRTKIFLWGFTEQNRQIDGFSSQSWGDDRITGIESVVNERLSQEGIDHTEFMLQPITLDGSGNRLAITGVWF